MTKKSKSDALVHKTERSAVGVLMHWIREIIKDKGLDLGLPDVDTGGKDRKSPDLVIYESQRSDNALLVLEAKKPEFDIFNESELKEPARRKATQRRSRYFAVTNFRVLLWYKTEAVNACKSEAEQLAGRYELSDIRQLSELEETRSISRIKNELGNFLDTLYRVQTGRTPEPKLPIDDFLIGELFSRIKSLSRHYHGTIAERYEKDKQFRGFLTKWFNEQNWSFSGESGDFDLAAHQTAYLLVNKILFYILLQAKRPRDLDPLELPEGLSKSAMLGHTLEGYFSQVLKIDYKTIYTTDFIDAIAFPESKEIVSEVKELVRILRRYDFSQLGYDVIGRIFERLVPPKERHRFGQYFTNPDVVDLILKFCLGHEDDFVLDPACGAGTFLVRAYQHKKMMNRRKRHEDLLERLWGVDIAKFPVHLATINLAINDLAVEDNYPNILHSDFFSLSNADAAMGGLKRISSIAGLNYDVREDPYPHGFDVIVGNPPYTRQEEFKEIGSKEDDYKSQLINAAIRHGRSGFQGKISRRAGIHVYFFLHGAKFLFEGGSFGFIVNNSWLDVHYGGGLQGFILDNFQVVAIIESRVERWFAEADVNTCIIILKKCTDLDARDENLTRFVYLKMPLAHFISPAGDQWEGEKQRLEQLDRLIETIMSHNKPYENDELRVVPIKQKELWEEGYDPDRGQYQGSKWGQYLRAPEVYFKIRNRSQRLIQPLNKFAQVISGVKTGADPWFFVKDITSTLRTGDLKKMARNKHFSGALNKLALIESGDGSRWLIEREYLAPIIRNPPHYRRISIEKDEIFDLAVFINESREKLAGTLIEKYIRHGEKNAYRMGKGQSLAPAETRTCQARQYWYQLPGLQPARLFWQKAFDVTHRHYLSSEPILANQRFYPVYPFKPKNAEIFAAYFNSTFIALYLEFQRAALGLGAIEATVEEVTKLPTIAPDAIAPAIRRKIITQLGKLSQREIGTIFEELGSESGEGVSLASVRPDRRELDRLFWEEVLGLSESEQLAIYRETVDLTRHRISRAESLRNESGPRNPRNISGLIGKLMEELDHRQEMEDD